MAVALKKTETLQNILSEVSSMDKTELKYVLSYIRSLRISRKGKNPVSVQKEGKALTMKQIDDIKHKSRNK
jgi:hypothetical protein